MNTIINSLKKNNGLNLLILNSLFAIILVYLCPLRFQEIDDIKMCWLASGKYTGTTNPHLVYIHHYYGILLNTLYDKFNYIEWYSVIFVILHTISITILEYIIIQKDNINSTKKKYLLTITIIYSYTILLIMQFTTISALIGTTAILLLLFSNRLHGYFLALVLFLISSFIRFDSLLLVTLLFGFYYIVFENRTNLFTRKILIVISFLIIAFGFHIIDKNYYLKNKEWNTFIQYNNARSSIFDNKMKNYHNVYSDLCTTNNISNEDMGLFNVAFMDPNILNTNQITKISNHFYDFKVLDYCKYSIHTLFRYPLKDTLFLLCFFIIILAPLFTSKKNKLKYSIIAFGMLFFIFALQIYSWPKPHLLLIITYTTILLNIIYIPNEDIKYNQKLNYKLCTFLLCCILIFFTGKSLINTPKARKQLQLQKELLLRNLDSKPIFIRDDNRSILWLSVFNVSEFYPTKISEKGWFTAAPFNQDIDSYKTLSQKGFYILWTKNSKSNMYFLKNYKKSNLENYSIKIKSEDIDSNSEYKLIKYTSQKDSLEF